MITNQDEFYKDLHAVRQIPIVPLMLEVICRTTGMGFAAIARVTDKRWIACSVRDEVDFGLKEGGELQIETTICNEIRSSHQPVVIDHVEVDDAFKHHHTPKMYGLQSYISYPIILRNGEFFGTLCAIDSKPALLKDPKIMGTFTMFAELLSFHLNSFEEIERSHELNQALNQKNDLLEKINTEQDNFIYTASHDLKSPISNIEGLVYALSETIEKDVIGQQDIEEIKELVDLMKVSVTRFSTTLKDLTTIIKTQRNPNDELTERIDVVQLTEEVMLDMRHLILQSNALIEVLCQEGLEIHFSTKNFRSILYNLLSNAIKYSDPGRRPEITVKAEMEGGRVLLMVQDNGLGIPEDKKDSVFDMFHRLHDHVEGTGIGLYIVNKMITDAGGAIKVESKVGVGTLFKVYLGKPVSEEES